MGTNKVETKNELIRFKNATFTTFGLAGMTKEEFKESHKGKIDIAGALKVVGKHLKKSEPKN